MKFRGYVLATALTMLAGSALADGDAAKGAVVFKKCATCHSAVDATNKVGPSLMGLIGRPVASVAGYEYSTAMKTFGAGKVWDEAELAAYLPKPQALVKGTKMAFVGLNKPEDVANVIAYLKDPAAVAK